MDAPNCELAVNRELKECFDLGWHTGPNLTLSAVDRKLAGALAVPVSVRLNRSFEVGLTTQLGFNDNPASFGLAFSATPRLYLPIFSSPLWNPFLQPEIGVGTGGGKGAVTWAGGELGLRHMLNRDAPNEVPGNVGFEGGVKIFGVSRVSAMDPQWGAALHLGVVGTF